MGDETEELLEVVKEAEDEVKYMKRLYDKGALDPEELLHKVDVHKRIWVKIQDKDWTIKTILNFFGKKSDVIKNPWSDVLRVSNPKAFNKMLEDAVYRKIMPKEGIMVTDAIKDYQTQMAKDRIDTVKEMLERGKTNKKVQMIE